MVTVHIFKKHQKLMLLFYFKIKTQNDRQNSWILLCFLLLCLNVSKSFPREKKFWMKSSIIEDMRHCSSSSAFCWTKYETFSQMGSSCLSHRFLPPPPHLRIAIWPFWKPLPNLSSFAFFPFYIIFHSNICPEFVSSLVFTICLKMCAKVQSTDL